MYFIKPVIDFFKGLNAQTKLLVFAGLVIGVLALENVHKSNVIANQEAQAKKTEQNLKAAQDSIRLVKDKAQKDEYDKLTYVYNSVDELKKQNAELAQEVKNTKGKVIDIQKQGFQIVHDTTTLIAKGEVKDSVVHISSTYDSVYSKGNFRSLAFNNTFNLKTNVATGELVKDSVGFTAVTGLKQTDNGYEIFVKPQYPGMKLISLEGAVIDKNFFKQPKSKPALITIGAHIGWVPITYDLISKKGDLNLARLGGGISINFNLIKLLGK